MQSANEHPKLCGLLLPCMVPALIKLPFGGGGTVKYILEKKGIVIII